MSGWEDSFVPTGGTPQAVQAGGWESSFVPSGAAPASAQTAPAEKMGALSVPQAEVGYLLNAVNGVPGVNLLKEAGSAIRGAGAAATGGSFSDEYNKSRENQQKLMSAAAEQLPDQTALGQVSAGIGSMGMLPTAGPSGSMIGDAVLGAAQGGGYGALSGVGSGSDTNSRVANALGGAKVGAKFGGAAGLAAGALTNLVGAYKGLYPSARLAAAQDAISEGIPVYKNNLSDSKALSYLSSASNEIPPILGGTSGRVPGQQAAMAKALNAKMGESGSELSSVNVQNALTDAGKSIGKINSKYSVPFDATTATNLAALQQEATKSLTGDNLTLFNQQIKNIESDAAANGGQLPGNLYQQTRSGLNEDIQANSNGSVAKYGDMLRRLRNVIDDRFQSMASNDDALALQRNRAYYTNAKTIEPLLERYPLGDYPMGALNAKTVDNPTLAPLGNVGQLFKNTTANSGTAQRQLIQKLGAGIGGLMGTGAILHEADPDWGNNMVELAGMAAVPSLANRALNPRITGAALNGYSTFQPIDPQIRALANALRSAPAAVPATNAVAQYLRQ